VRQRRAGRLRDDEATLFTGEFWTGRRGLQLGLADGLGELRTTLQARYGAKVHLPMIAQRRRLLSRFGLGTAIDGIGIGPSTLAALEERLHWQRFGL
jgi:ClpP class serine protease